MTIEEKLKQFETDFIDMLNLVETHAGVNERERAKEWLRSFAGEVVNEILPEEMTLYSCNCLKIIDEKAKTLGIPLNKEGESV